MNEKKVELVAWLQNPGKNWDAEDSATCGARGCFSEFSSFEIHKQEILKEKKDEAGKEKIFAETSGRGHGAVLDQSEFLFSIDNLTRASTLFLCAPQYASHLQQSLRRATAQRGFHLPKSLEGTFFEELMIKQFELYDKMQSSRVPAEDAKYILPLYTKTTIQTKINARELMHLHLMTSNYGVPDEVRDTVDEMIKKASEIAPRLMQNRGINYETLAWMPASQLFIENNQTIEDLVDNHSFNKKIPEQVILLNYSGIQMKPDLVERAVMKRDEAELANMKHYHFTFLAPMSIACFHQATRQRTWDQSVQAMSGALYRSKYVVPKSIDGSEFEKEFRKLNESTINYLGNFMRSNPEVIGVVPHSLRTYDIIHINGWNAVHSIGKRTCTEAQWEIRDIAKQMAKYIKVVAPEIGKYAVPQGITYGKCPEKKSCGVCFKK